MSGRVVEIFVPASKLIGSGYLLTHRMILTSFHVVAAIAPSSRPPAGPAGSLVDRIRTLAGSAEACRVRTLSNIPRRPFHDAIVVWWSAEFDVALLAVIETNWIEPTYSATDWNNITGSDPVDFTAVGFPAIEQSQDGRSRESREIFGKIPPLTWVKNERWTLQLGASIGSFSAEQRSAWAGISGAAVFARESLVGVVQCDVDPTDKTRLELRAVPVRLFAGNPDFVAWLAADAGPNGWRKALDSTPVLTSRVPRNSFVDGEIPRRRDLVGRTALLAEAREQLMSGEDTALVSGLPGAGKTALAANLARDDEINAAFPDGHLWLSVGKVDPGRWTHWVNRMALWGQKLGVSPDLLAEAQADQDGKGLVELININLGARRALLVFDDVWEREDAIVFKDIGPECVRLLTTRFPRVSSLFARQPTMVEELDQSASLDLIELYCPGARRLLGDALNDAVTVLAGLPLALLLVAQKLKDELSYGEESGREFLRKVQSVETRLDLQLDITSYDQRSRIQGAHRTLQAIISLATDGLSDQEMRALSALTTFPPKLNTFSGAAAEHIVGDKRTIRTIRDNGLVELAEISGPRYSMHQAIADFARRGQEGDDDAYRRMAEYFVTFIEHEVADTASDRWVYTLEPEFENIRAALSWSVRAQEAHIGLQLMAALWPYWYERSLFQRARELAKRILAIPPQEGEVSGEYLLLRAKVLNDAGNYAYNMADLTEALELHNEALRIRTGLEEEGLTAGSKNNIALVLRERGDYLSAAKLFNEALEINERSRHPNWQLWRCMNLNNLGITSLRIGELTQAREYQERSEEAFRDLGSSWGVAMVRLNRADAMLAQEDSGVESLLVDVLAERWAVRDDKAVSAAMRGFAVLRLRNGNPSGARRASLASLLLSAPLADRLGEGAALEILILACRDLGDWQQAARAGGALRGYWEISTAAPVPVRAAELSSALSEMQRSAPIQYQDQFNQAHQVAADGLSHLGTALGSSLREIDPEAEVLEVLSSLQSE